MNALFPNGTKDPSFAAVSVGETFDPVTLVVDEAYVANARFSLGDYKVCHDKQGRELVPGTALARDLQQLFLTRYDPNRIVGLHQAEEIIFAAPARVGDVVTLSGSVVDKFEKRGKGYFVLDCRAHDAEGRLLVQQISTEIMEMPDLSAQPAGGAAQQSGDRAASRRITGVWPQTPPVQHFSRELTPSIAVTPMVKVCDLAQVAVFSGIGLGRYNTHTDIRVAQAAGFATALAQGMMETCWMSQMLAEFFGPSWDQGGWIRTNYLRPVLAGDTITLRAVLTEIGADTAELEVWAENQHQQMTAAGWARCRLPASVS
jgi:acyl dehydratase